jgi:hypothetical protein
MKLEIKKNNEVVKIPKAGILSFVASQLKGKVLFPKKMEEAKKMLQHAKIVQQ